MKRLNGESCLILAIISTIIIVASGVCAFIYFYFYDIKLIGIGILIVSIVFGAINFIIIKTLANIAMQVDELWQKYYKEEIYKDE